MKVKISDEMERNGEHGRIKLPSKLMHEFGYSPGEFIQARDKFGDVLQLIVESTAEESDVASLTRRDFLRAFIKDKQFATKPVENIMLGCDPEVFLVDANNRIVPAYRFFHKSGEIGNDGMVMEFRPPPNTNEDIVVNNLNMLLKRARSMLNQTRAGESIRIVAASSFGKLTAGFHLHYGLPNRLLGFSSDAKRIAVLTTYVMDYYVGIPSIMTENDIDNTRRTLQYIPYGKPGQFRLDKRTLEYRLPGAANLKHPILARGLLALGAVVIEDFVSRIKRFTVDFSLLGALSDEHILKEFYDNLPEYQRIYEAICCPNTKLAKAYLEKTIKSDVRKMIGYEKRKEAIEGYFNILENNDITSNMELNWNF